MTVSELIEELKKYPPEAIVAVDAEGVPDLSAETIRLVEYTGGSILWLATYYTY